MLACFQFESRVPALEVKRIQNRQLQVDVPAVVDANNSLDPELTTYHLLLLVRLVNLDLSQGGPEEFPIISTSHRHLAATLHLA